MTTKTRHWQPRSQQPTTAKQPCLQARRVHPRHVASPHPDAPVSRPGSKTQTQGLHRCWRGVTQDSGTTPKLTADPLFGLLLQRTASSMMMDEQTASLSACVTCRTRHSSKNGVKQDRKYTIVCGDRPHLQISCIACSVIPARAPTRPCRRIHSKWQGHPSLCGALP